MAPSKMGNTFDQKTLKSPLTVGAPHGEKGPQVHNSPVMVPADPLKLIPGGSKKR